MFEREIRDLAFVPRWGIVRTIRRQSVAEHSYYVAIYAETIAQRIGWRPSERDTLFRISLSHDWDEILTSDVAAPAKRVLKKAAGDGWGAFTLWLQRAMVQRFPEYLVWLGGGIGEGTLHEAEAIVKAADLFEAVMYLAEEQNMGNGNVADRRAFLESALWDALKVLESFAAPDDLSRLEHEMIEAIHRQTRGSSLVVRGDE